MPCSYSIIIHSQLTWFSWPRLIYHFFIETSR
jgi:hypothetical protein